MIITDLAETPQSDNKGLGFIQTWGDLKHRLSPKKNVSDEKESPSLSKDFQKLESRLEKTSK